ncbi:Uncharacterized protein, UPF0303 family [Jatrophihabitans endophyticus]|uniref:UPF0303 protein SAMN05443575_3253 n=1 Tax=Jatrophihabitans endophyticus TaxID=1206085 RepID=A0A1M5Q0M8_9ACTN|nr:heme-degrading domain-containing protein [Jatrophihabitans endophyticus]SHH07452.1 Uncharacterized protein, UPF0303 family [Jatrophihabitans endophyticus]
MTDSGSPTIAELEEQQRHLQFDRFDNLDAWRLGCTLVELATTRTQAVTIDIRRHGQQLFHAALPGTTPENDAWIERKIRVVNRFAASSLLVGLRLAESGRKLDQELGIDPALYAAHGGCVPVTIRDVGVVGTVTVSGLPQVQDHALVVEGMEGLMRDHATRDTPTGASAP